MDVATGSVEHDACALIGGVGPHPFVRRQRVARACTLLTRTDTPLLDVALSCGFAEQSHLNRVFKKHLGVTPGRYRACR